MRLFRWLLQFCAALCSLLTLSCGQEALPTAGSTTQGTQIYQAPPTVLSGSGSCLYFDSRTNVSRTCTLTSSCFSYIRQLDDGSLRVKRGCSSNCQDVQRRRKAQVCCSTHLCNTHELTADDFGKTPPTATPTLCYQSVSNGTCAMSTACFSRLTYLSDGTYQIRQGCIRGPECFGQSDHRTIQQCCTSNLCNVPIPPSSHPRHTPTVATPLPASTRPTTTPFFLPPILIPVLPPSIPSSPPPPSNPPLSSSPSNPPLPSTSSPPSNPPSTTSPYVPPILFPVPGPTASSLRCHCSECATPACQGEICGWEITYSSSPMPQINSVCVEDVSTCNEGMDPDPQTGTRIVACCVEDYCNTALSFPTTMLPDVVALPTTTALLQDTTITTDTATLPTTTSATPTHAMPTSTAATTHLLPPSPSASTSDDIYFTFTAVVAVTGGLLILTILSVALVALLLHLKRRNPSRHPPTKLSRQPSPDCRVTQCYARDRRGSPLSSSSMASTISGESQSLSSNFLKQLGTSV